MTESDKDQHTEAVNPAENQSHSGARVWVWLAVVLALAAWAVLLWGSGYVALGLAVAALVSGGIGAARARLGLRRVAVTAIIAAGVLALVVAAYIIVLKLVI